MSFFGFKYMQYVFIEQETEIKHMLTFIVKA